MEENSQEEDEEKQLRFELETQIAEQRASLQMVQEANDAGPSKELQEMCSELVASIQTMEESLAQFNFHQTSTPQDKDPLQDPSSSLHDLSNEDRLHKQGAIQDVTYAASQKQPRLSGRKPNGAQERSQSEAAFETAAGFSGRPSEESQESSWKIGDRCRFRGQDGRWYNGNIVELGSGDTGHAVVAYLTPTTPQMRLCPFFAEQRCRFGEDCRNSHGKRVRLRSLQPYEAINLENLDLGDRVFALREDTGLWEAAELERKNEDAGGMELQVAFTRDGKRATVDSSGVESAVVQTPEHVPDDSDTSERSDLSEDEQVGLGARMTSAGVDYRADAEAMTSAGIQNDVRLLAGWEEHTRGFASKMMASMGFVAGSGLGKDKQGITAPIPVEVLPKNVGLDSVRRREAESGGKKKSRGGEKSRKRKAAQAARDARAGEGPEDDMFSLINRQLAVPGGPSVANAQTQREPTRKVGRKGAGDNESERQKLLAQKEDVEELQRRVAKLQEMADRNRKDRFVSAAVHRKLDETRKALASAEAAHASANREIHEKESHKKLLKW